MDDQKLEKRKRITEAIDSALDGDTQASAFIMVFDDEGGHAVFHGGRDTVLMLLGHATFTLATKVLQGAIDASDILDGVDDDDDEPQATVH